MWNFMAGVGLLVFFGGLVGTASPSSLRLRRRGHALAVAAAGFVALVVGANLDMAAQEERERAEREAEQAELRAEQAERTAAIMARRRAERATQWNIAMVATGPRNTRSVVKAGTDRRLFVGVNCQGDNHGVTLTPLRDSGQNFFDSGEIEARWSDGTVDHYDLENRSSASSPQIRRLIEKLRRLETVTFNVTQDEPVSDTISLSGSSAAIDSLRCGAPASASRQSGRPASASRGNERPSRSPTRSLTAQAFVPRLTWNDMESIGTFAGRMPPGITGQRIGQTGETRRIRYAFPGGGAIILLARPCGGRGTGLCVWAVDVE